MKKLFFTFFTYLCISVVASFAYNNPELRDYDGIEIPKGSFIQVISAQEISTVYCDEGTALKFISTNDLYLYETNVIPRETEFFGYVEKINEPIVGTNASMIIKVTKLKLADGFEIPVRGYICAGGSTLIGGELTAPTSFEKKQSLRKGFKSMSGFVPGPERRMGEHKVIASGADLIIMLISPLFITHTVTN